MPRSKGVVEEFPRGTRKLLDLYRKAQEAGLEHDRDVEEAWGLLYGVMTGDIPVHRHIRDRMSAACFIIEAKLGKARQRVEVTDRRDGVYKAEFSDGAPVRSPAAPDLPN